VNLHIWDVQHGSAAYLRTPLNRHVVIDLGVGDISEADVRFSPLRLIKSWGVQRLDEVIITHPHRDHLDDIFVFDSLNPRVLMRPRHLTETEIRAGNQSIDTPIIDKYLEIDRRYTGTVAATEDPSAESVSGMQIVSFTPSLCARGNLNNHSIVTFMRYANSTICLPGDNEAASWNELIKQSGFADWLKSTDILVASHHGREAGYCSEIFELCKPVLVIVSDGPGSDTSAVDKYLLQASGWSVRSRKTGEAKTRYVLTTRCDGSIYVSAGWNKETPYLAVSTE
jgi:competence protein ComEC